MFLIYILIGVCKGMTFSEERKRNIGLGQLGNKRGPETSEKLRRAAFRRPREVQLVKAALMRAARSKKRGVSHAV
jgi:hypothetical protein